MDQDIIWIISFLIVEVSCLAPIFRYAPVGHFTTKCQCIGDIERVYTVPRNLLDHESIIACDY